MITVRIIAHEPDASTAQHLGRIGVAPAALAGAGRAHGSWQILLSGLDKRAAKLLAGVEAGPAITLGDAERAPGTALLTGRGGELDQLAAALARAEEGAELSRRLAVAMERYSREPAPVAIGKRRFEWGSRTYLMGVINVTPDSFSDGGKHYTADTAVAGGERLAAEGVDVLDIGGESTRPGSEPVPVQRELDRVIPVVERLVKLVDVPISVDTTKAAVAEAAAKAGASLVNDISGFTFDPEMAPTCARAGLSACAMHIRGTPRTMQQDPTYLDLVGEVLEGLGSSLEIAERAGLPLERVIVDPGLGFGKTAEHNLFLLRHLGQLKSLGRPILVGASRKSFIGKITGRAVGERLPGSLAVLSAAVLGGAHLVRVHDVSESKVAAQMIDAVVRARSGGVAFEAR